MNSGPNQRCGSQCYAGRPHRTVLACYLVHGAGAAMPIDDVLAAPSSVNAGAGAAVYEYARTHAGEDRPPNRPLSRTGGSMPVSPHLHFAEGARHGRCSCI